MAGFACLMSLRSEPDPPWKTKETGLASLEDTFPKRSATGAHLDETCSRGVAELRPSCGRAAAEVRPTYASSRTLSAMKVWALPKISGSSLTLPNQHTHSPVSPRFRPRVSVGSSSALPGA